MAEHKKITVLERTISCRFCGSTDLSKSGWYKDNQYYICKNCGRKSAETDTYPRMKYPKELIIRALTYYYNGMSSWNIARTFNDMKNIDLPQSTIWRWIIKYSEIVNTYVMFFEPHLSDVWVADETAVDIWGEQYWFWDIIDIDTRFLIASHLSKTRTMNDAIELFSVAKAKSKIRPRVIITDKLGIYPGAFNDVFYTRYKEGHVEHLTSRGFTSPVNTNLIERFHGAVKQRSKVMRDLKEPYSASVILDGFVTHYNFFLEHSYLNYVTPADMAGIGENIRNWGDLIELATGSAYL